MEAIMTACVSISLNNDFTHAVGQISLTYACFVSLSIEHQPCLQLGGGGEGEQFEAQTLSYINTLYTTYRGITPYSPKFLRGKYFTVLQIPTQKQIS